MDKAEAATLLASHLATWRGRSYRDLRALINAPESTSELTGPTGTKYQVEVQVFWDAGPDGPIRVTGSIDDRGWRALVPLSVSFVVLPEQGPAERPERA